MLIILESGFICTKIRKKFFSSRRRHRRCSRDWSSDVCSSDLAGPPGGRWGNNTTRCAARQAVAAPSASRYLGAVPGHERLPDGSVTSPTGFNASAVAAGLKDGGQPDVGLLVSATSCRAAGVFTQNRVRAAPVLYDEALLKERPGRLRGVVMNARVANACTGERGLKAAEA